MKVYFTFLSVSEGTIDLFGSNLFDLNEIPSIGDVVHFESFMDVDNPDEFFVTKRKWINQGDDEVWVKIICETKTYTKKFSK